MPQKVDLFVEVDIGAQGLMKFYGSEKFISQKTKGRKRIPPLLSLFLPVHVLKQEYHGQRGLGMM